ncbi:hypothetical protein PVAP13_8NG088000 [Panicum virgatum]|uniref:Uncharacterized protein n=1 Tax=Panicum virgatum TaxID=38727 RepID=A0A8T0P2M0_PANVG|nr:hypothetical protein PVAP13_8NG088000 [Panicum virgatum]
MSTVNSCFATKSRRGFLFLCGPFFERKKGRQATCSVFAFRGDDTGTTRSNNALPVI